MLNFSSNFFELHCANSYAADARIYRGGTVNCSVFSFMHWGCRSQNGMMVWSSQLRRAHDVAILTQHTLKVNHEHIYRSGILNCSVFSFMR